MKSTNKLLIALGAGIVVGGVLGLLFAPKKGADLRKDIANGGKKLTSDIKDKINRGKEKMNGLRKEAEELAEELT